MSCPDSAVLWSLEAGELAAEDRAVLLDHALACLACQATRNELRSTASVLALASGVRPAVSWSRVGAGIEAALEKETLRRARQFPWFRLVMPVAPLALGVAAIVAFVAWPRGTPSDVQVAESVKVPVQHEVPQQQMAQLESPEKQVAAVKAPVVAHSKIAGTVQQVENAQLGKELARIGAQLKSGERIVTGKKGHAAIKLTSGPRVAIDESSAVTVVSEKGITVHSGTLLVDARDAKRKLAVSGQGLQVRAAETAFSMSSSADYVDVAVAEGSVLVERAQAGAELIQAGESVRFLRGNSLHGALTELQRRAFEQFGVPVKKAAGELAQSAETLFLSRAEASLKSGQCGGFLLGLETLAFDAETPEVRERARIFKARCHDERLEPSKATAEYSRYLRDFPNGPAADEARRALAAEK